MASVSAIRDGLAAQLSNIAGLRVLSYAPDRVSVPAAAVEIESVEFDRTFGRGMDEFSLVVRLYASRADDRAGQDRLDTYLAGSGTASVKAAIEADASLGGIAQTLRVTRVENYGVYEVAGVSYFGAEFRVSVWARGN